MLGFKPETLAEAKARWYDAVLRLWAWDEFDPEGTVSLLLTGHFDRPGLYRKHVFDFHDGLRLIVSKDQYTDAIEQYLHDTVAVEQYLHVSASVRGPMLKKFITRGNVFDFCGLASLVHDRVLFMSGKHVTLGFYRGQPRHLVNVVHCFDPPLPAGLMPPSERVVPEEG